MKRIDFERLPACDPEMDGVREARLDSANHVLIEIYDDGVAAAVCSECGATITEAISLDALPDVATLPACGC